MSSDTWTALQDYKNKKSSLREKLARRKKERQERIENLVSSPGSSTPVSQACTPGTSTSSLSPAHGSTDGASPATTRTTVTPIAASNSPSNTKTVESTSTPQEPASQLSPSIINEIEKHLLVMLSDITLILPMAVSTFHSSVQKQLGRSIPASSVEDLMQKFAAQMLITLETHNDSSAGSVLMVDSVDHNKLSAVTDEMEGFEELDSFSRKRKKDSEDDDSENTPKQIKKTEADKTEDAIEALLSMDTSRQRENKRMTDEILQLLSKPTAKEQSLIEKFKSVGGAQVKEFCPNGTKEECVRVIPSGQSCDKLHFRKIINKHTDESLGDCSFLNTCFHMDTCKYVHYEIDYPKLQRTINKTATSKKIDEGSTILFPPQWVQCDLRSFDMTILGKFAVIMADPPWDIHMELPYGTMGDDEMRHLQVPVMQDEGYIFLWVTGRAMELGRECLQLWGYERVEELIWVKTNQLQRIIRTGRTGHWLNHGKEHCLVGVKGNPKNMNRGLDCDVIVAEVRATSHKPDEIYGIIERLSPGTRKIELFGRPHNVQPNWVTLGNQLDGVKLNEPDVVRAYKERYPDSDCMKPKS